MSAANFSWWYEYEQFVAAFIDRLRVDFVYEQDMMNIPSRHEVHTTERHWSIHHVVVSHAIDLHMGRLKTGLFHCPSVTVPYDCFVHTLL